MTAAQPQVRASRFGLAAFPMIPCPWLMEFLYKAVSTVSVKSRLRLKSIRAGGT